MYCALFKSYKGKIISFFMGLVLIFMAFTPVLGAEDVQVYGKNEVFSLAGDAFSLKEFAPMNDYDAGGKKAYGLTLQKANGWYSASSATAEDDNNNEVVFVYTVENSPNPIRAIKVTLESGGQSVICTGVISAPPNMQEVTFVFLLDGPEADMAYVYSEIIGGPAGSSIGINLRDATAATGEAPAGASASSAITALASASPVLVNGENVGFEAYNIDGSNYFKLRDIAFAINGTQKQFGISWDEVNNAIALTSNMAYTPAGGELEPGTGGNKQAVAANSKIIVDGAEVSIDAYNIDGSNYFKLRDIGKTLDFNVGWDAEQGIITVDTSAAYTE